MASQPIDYKAVISDIELRRAQINAQFDAAISAIRQVMAMDNSDVRLGLPAGAMSETSERAPYRGLSMLDAAMRHMRAVGAAVPNLTLAKALEEGGYRHKSKNFANTVNSVLWRRAKTVGDIKKSERGWEWAQG